MNTKTMTTVRVPIAAFLCAMLVWFSQSRNSLADTPDATLAVNIDGIVTHGTEVLDKQGIADLCAELTGSGGMPRVLIEAPRNLPVGHIKTIVRHLSDAGVTDLVFRSLPSDDDSSHSIQEGAHPSPTEIIISDSGKLTGHDVLSGAALFANGLSVRLKYPSKTAGTVTVIDPKTENGDLIVIQLRRDEILLNGAQVTFDELRDRLIRYCKLAEAVESEARVFLRAAKEATTTQLFTILDICGELEIEIVPSTAK